MKLRTLGMLPLHAAMASFAAVFMTSLDQYLEGVGKWPIPMLAVNVCAAVVVALTAATLVHAAGSASARERVLRLLLANRRVLLALGAVVIASFIAAFSRTAWLDVGPRYVLFTAYTATVFLFSMLLPFPAHRREWFWWYLFAAFVVTVGSILTDVWRPGTFSIIPERAAGFTRNPNGGGFLVVAICTTLLSFERIRFLDLFLLVATTGAVVATQSRGAMLLMAFVSICYAGCVVRHAWRRGIGTVLKVIGGLGLLVGLTVGGTALLIGQRMFASPGSRVDMLLGREQAIGPNESRVELLEHSLELVRESPVFGYGSGFTARMPQGPHNMYISRWLDDGLLGMLCYIWLLVAMALTFVKRRFIPGIVFTALLVTEGFFNHNIFEERAFLILPGVLLGLSYFAARETVPAGNPRGWSPAPVRGPVPGATPPTLSA